MVQRKFESKTLQFLYESYVLLLLFSHSPVSWIVAFTDKWRTPSREEALVRKWARRPLE